MTYTEEDFEEAMDRAKAGISYAIREMSAEAKRVYAPVSDADAEIERMRLHIKALRAELKSAEASIVRAREAREIASRGVKRHIRDNAAMRLQCRKAQSILRDIETDPEAHSEKLRLSGKGNLVFSDHPAHGIDLVLTEDGPVLLKKEEATL